MEEQNLWSTLARWFPGQPQRSKRDQHPINSTNTYWQSIITEKKTEFTNGPQTSDETKHLYATM